MMNLSEMRLTDALEQIDAKFADSGAVIAQQPNIKDLTAAPTMADFNGLLACLRLAGVLASS